MCKGRWWGMGGQEPAPYIFLLSAQRTNQQTTPLVGHCSLMHSQIWFWLCGFISPGRRSPKEQRVALPNGNSLVFLKVRKEHEMSSLLEIEGQLNQFSRQSVVAVTGQDNQGHKSSPQTRVGLKGHTDQPTTLGKRKGQMLSEFVLRWITDLHISRFSARL